MSDHQPPAFSPFRIRCQKCDKGLKVQSPKLLGQTVACPGCGNKLSVPSAQAVAKATAAKQAPPTPAPAQTVSSAEQRREMRAAKKQSARNKQLLVAAALLLVSTIGVGAYLGVTGSGKTATPATATAPESASENTSAALPPTERSSDSSATPVSATTTAAAATAQPISTPTHEPTSNEQALDPIASIVQATANQTASTNTVSASAAVRANTPSVPVDTPSPSAAQALNAAIAKASQAPDTAPPAFTVPYPRGHKDDKTVLRANPAGVIELVTYYADKDASQIRFHGDGSFEQWVNKDDTLRWKIAVDKPGAYRLQLNTGADANNAGNTFIATASNGQTIEAAVPDTGDLNTMQLWDAGTFTFDRAGTYTITLKPKAIRRGTQLGKFRSLALMPEDSPRYFDFLHNDWQHDAPDILAARNTFAVGPVRHNPNMDRKSYVIVTRNHLVKGLTEFDNFVKHKEKLGFNVIVITENHYGRAVGVQAGLNIRKWLNRNYRSRNIAYALMIGDGHPQKGTVPVGIAGNYRQVLEDFKAGKDNTGYVPTDLFYADCSGRVMDANNDGHHFDREDYRLGAEGKDGPDRKWDILVGRIPYFGEDSGWGKMSDVDAILRKTIDYENEKDIHWRYNFGIDGTTWNTNSALYEWAGINYISRDVAKGSHLRQMQYGYNNTNFLANNTVGYVRTGGHANPHFIEGGISRDSIREQLIGRPQVVKEYGGCDCGQPEYNDHLAYTHLRYQAIGVAAASRSITVLKTTARPYYSSWRWAMITQGLSQGHAHWNRIFEDAKHRGSFHGGNMMFMFYGDPSVRPFPHGIKTSYTTKIRPVHRRTLLVAESSALVGETLEFDIANNREGTTAWAITRKPEWVNLDARFGALGKGKRQTIKATLNDAAKALEPGEYRGIIDFIAAGHEQQREIYLKIEPRAIVGHETFDNPTNTIPGISGQAASPVAADRDLRLADFVGGVDSFAVGFWLNWQELPNRRAVLATGGTRASKIELSFEPGSRKLKLHLKPEGYAGAVSWIDSYAGAMTVNVEADFAPSAGRWHHVMFALDRETHEAILFADGEEIRRTPLHRAAGYIANDLRAPKNVTARYDDAIVLNDAPTAEELQTLLAQGPEPKLTDPADGYLAASDDATLHFQQGGTDVASYQVFVGVTEAALRSAKPITTAAGQVTLPMSKPFEDYSVRIDRVMKDGQRVEGAVQQVSTYDVIDLSNADLDAGIQGWEVPSGKAGPWVGRGEFHFNANSTARQSTGPFVPGKLYGVKAKAAPGYSGPLKVSLFARKDGVDTLLQSKHIQIHDAFDDALHWRPIDPTQYRGSEIVVEVARSHGHVRLTEVQAFLSNAELPNQAPFIDRSKLLPVYAYEVGNNLTDFAIGSAIADRDGDSFTIEKMSGPTWLDVRNGDRLFTPFGPKATDIGTHTMRFKVTDEHLNTSYFEIKIKVSKPGEMTFSAFEAELPVGKEVRLTGNLITHFIADDATATWRFTPSKSGTYKVTIFGGTLHEGNVGKLTVAGQTKAFAIQPTGDYKTIKPHTAGTFRLTAGKPTTLVLGVAERVQGLIDVESVKIERIR